MAETIIGEEDEEAVKLIVGQCGFSELPHGARIIGFRDKKGVLGAFMFERYTGEGGSIHAHWAARDKTWLKKYMLTLAFMYIFDQLKCKIVYGEVRSKASTTLDIDKRLGFVEAARLKNYFPDDDLVVLELHKQDCVWLPDEFKEVQDGR